MEALAANYPPKLRFLFKPAVPNLQTRFLTGGPRSWPCIKAPWPNDAYGSQRAPARLWIYATDSTVCVVGFGWANRAEATAGMLMRGMLQLHDRLAMSAPRPSAFRLLPFERVVTINLLDSYIPARRRSPHESLLAYSCKGAQAHGCGVGLVPHFGLANYHEAGLGTFRDLSEELATAGLRRARTRMCGWAGNPKNHRQRALYGAQAASQPHLLAFANQSQYLPLRAQVDEWACLIDLVGYGFSARVPLLLHSGRVVLKVTPPPPSPWLWYEDSRAFPEVLTPWSHFVPVKADLSDLVKQVPRRITQNCTAPRLHMLTPRVLHVPCRRSGFETIRTAPTGSVRYVARPLHDIAIASIAWCLAHKRGVGGGPYIARYCAWARYRGGEINEVYRANHRVDECTIPGLTNEYLVEVHTWRACRFACARPTFVFACFAGAAGQAYARRYLTTQRASEFLARQVTYHRRRASVPSCVSDSPLRFYFPYPCTRIFGTTMFGSSLTRLKRPHHKHAQTHRPRCLPARIMCSCAGAHRCTLRIAPLSSQSVAWLQLRLEPQRQQLVG